MENNEEDIIWETRIVPVRWEYKYPSRKIQKVIYKGVTQWWGKNGINSNATFRNLNSMKPNGR